MGWEKAWAVIAVVGSQSSPWHLTNEQIWLEHIQISVPYEKFHDFGVMKKRGKMRVYQEIKGIGLHALWPTSASCGAQLTPNHH